MVLRSGLIRLNAAALLQNRHTPLPFLPFYLEQTVQHYIVHAIYGRDQRQLIAAMRGQLRQSR